MIVSHIQRFSLHDGPGIRTTVFLKGCNLRCRWCHNPETISPRPQVEFRPDRCLGCRACLEVCPRGAHVADDGARRFERRLCIACGACAAGCYAGALVLIGKEMTVAGILAEVLADREFYARSGGGVTLSGGEPLYQADAAADLLRACKGEGIHTAIETNLAWPWERLAGVLPAVELVMMDVKLMDARLHEHWTGAGNERVLDNARRLAREGVPLIARTPVVQGVNASVEEIGRIADFLSGLESLLYYEPLPYNPLGAGKYEGLGLEYRGDGLSRPERAKMQALAGEARRRGLQVRCSDDGA